MVSFPSTAIRKFLGLNKTNDKLSLLFGQMMLNENWLYLPNGGLEQRGGGNKLIDPPSVGPLFGVGNYENNTGSSFIIAAQGTDLYSLSGTWSALSLSLTVNQKTRFEPAGFDSGRALYAVNGADSILKVVMSGTSVVGSQITDGTIPVDLEFIRLHKNRLFFAKKDPLYFTDVLDFDATGGLTNIKVYPGQFGFIKGLAVWGDALFIFKEEAVFVLPNADVSNPADNWIILKTDAKTGTQSPDSIARTVVGLMYLSTDNKIRLISPSITFSSGEFTLGGSGSPDISHLLNEEIDIIIDDSTKNDAVAIVFNDLYIINFQTSSNANSFNDKTYFADTTKFIEIEDINVKQPFWGEFTGFDYNYFVQQTVSSEIKLYGIKGLNGIIQETLNPSIINDDGAAIIVRGQIGWIPVGGSSVYKKFLRMYFVAEIETGEISLIVNGYKYGDILPENGVGSSKTFSSITGSGVVGTAIVGTDVIGVVGSQSIKYRLNNRGNYFTVYFENANINQFSRINKLEIYYRPKVKK